MFFYAGNFKVNIVSKNLENEGADEAVLIKSNVDLLAPDFKGNATNIVLRAMIAHENFEGFNKIIDGEQNVIPTEEMDDQSDVFYGVGNACDDVVCGHFTLLEKVSEVHAEGIMKIEPHVIEVTV